MGYRSTELAARERIDLLEDELLEAEAELERQAELLQAAELRMHEQIRRQRVDDTQKTRAVRVATPKPDVSPRAVASLSLLGGMVVGALVPTLVALWLVAPAEVLEAEEELTTITNTAGREWQTQLEKGGAYALTPPHEQPGILAIYCTPECDYLTVHGRMYSAAPGRVALPPGSHRVTLRRENIFKTIVVQIVSGQTISQVVNMK